MMRVLPVPFTPTAPTTAAVYRVVDERRSTFVKILQSPRHWLPLAGVPAELRDRFLASFPWRAEADFLASGFALPPGLRMPNVVRIDELGDDRVGLWLEDVECADVPWDLSRFSRAAWLLGRWAGRRFGGEPGGVVRMLAERLPPLAWVPGLLDRLDALPQAIGHGDACPQNLLVPKDDPDTFVVIDVTWPSPCPVGYDLGQLLVGLAETATLPVAALPAIREEIIDAYVAGLRDEGHEVPAADVALGCDGPMIIRTAFHSRPELAEYLMGLRM